MIDMEGKKLYVAVAALLLVMGIAISGCIQDDQSNEEEAPDQPETEVSLPEPGNGTTVYFFWGDGCPYCAEEKPFLEELDREHDDLEVKMYEVYNSRENQEMYQNVAEEYGITARGVPATFIGSEHWIGFNEQMSQQIESKIMECLEESCEGPLD